MKTRTAKAFWKSGRAEPDRLRSEFSLRLESDKVGMGMARRAQHALDVRGKKCETDESNILTTDDGMLSLGDMTYERTWDNR